MFKHVGVVGAGTMGAGIAQVVALSKVDVLIYDINDTVLRRANEIIKADLRKGVQKGKITQEQLTETMGRIHPRTALQDLGYCDLIVEAVVEDLRTKRDIFKRLDETAKGTTILATNTSSLPVTAIAVGARKSDRVVGLHFFNPVHIMKLVEVIRGERTSDEVITTSVAFAQHLGKTPVVVRDTPGFIVNRIARPFYGEALRLLGEHVATAEQIDRLVKSEGGFAMGPFELMDLIGIDVNLSVTQSMYDQYFGEPRFRPHPIQKQMVDSGKLGKKTGRGFYEYDEGERK